MQGLESFSPQDANRGVMFQTHLAALNGLSLMEKIMRRLEAFEKQPAMEGN